METIQELLKQEFWGNLVQNYLIAIGVFVVFLIIFKFFEKKVLKKVEKWARKTKTDIDDEIVKIIEKMPSIFYLYFSFYIAIQFLTINPTVNKVMDAILIILLIYWAAKVASDLIEYGFRKLAVKKGAKKEERTTSYYALSLIAKIALWSIGFLLILSNLGVNITALVASLGIGGIAIALALQNILSDLFSSFSLYFDKPFEIGDFIVVGDHRGTVKKIGLKTTRIQALQGEEIVISNNELTSTRVRNFKKMKKRRIDFEIGVTYDTSVEKLKKIPKIIKKIIKETKKCDFDRAHFREFADFSLIFEVVYYINSADFLDHMNSRHTINLGIKEAFKKEGIEMAFPTQTIYVNREK